ncbi:hypothetical protein ACGFNF_13035 [Micromonospora sp. NPDC048868]|uniref:hypothetical protein n=1 Tax=Micromonospora sp. NPDC048868 TaxID=3364258 RepID=UPI0037127612
MLFDDDLEWWIQGRVLSHVMSLVPADVAAADEFDEWLSPARAVGLLDVRKIEDPEAAKRLVRALSVGAHRALTDTQEKESTNEALMEFYRGLCRTADEAVRRPRFS